MQIHSKVVWALLFIAFEILVFALFIGFAIVFQGSSFQQMESKVIELEIYFHTYLLGQLVIRILVARAKKQKQSKEPTKQTTM